MSCQYFWKIWPHVNAILFSYEQSNSKHNTTQLWSTRMIESRFKDCEGVLLGSLCCFFCRHELQHGSELLHRAYYISSTFGQWNKLMIELHECNYINNLHIVAGIHPDVASWCRNLRQLPKVKEHIVLSRFLPKWCWFWWSFLIIYNLVLNGNQLVQLRDQPMSF
jgi:hypothetical protein